MPNIDVNSVEKKVNNERTEKTLSGEKRIFIVGDSVIKLVNGQENLENQKFAKSVRPCHGATIIFHIGTNNLPPGKGNEDIAESIINLEMSVKTQSFGVLISSITVR